MRYFSFYILQCLILSILVISCASCESDNQETNNNTDNDSIEFYFGADLSYVNEMEDCGAVYKDQSGVEKEVYSIFKQEGTNLVRLRLWHNTDWTDYSNYSDVKKAIQRAKNSNMRVLLDFHYSDTWADPSRQLIPQAWLSELNNTEALGELLYNYTYNTLNELSQENLLPEIVQVGNEINTMILQEDETNGPIDWQRNSYLINKGIKAIRDISELKNKPIEIMLHIAQPENGLWWFEQATTNDITDFDWIGLSYYPLWSEYELDEVQVPLETLINTYNKKLMIVETAYPFTLNNADSANNILGEEALTGNFPASEQGQLDYLNQLYINIKDAGGQGLVYWEPAWVSTNCFTQWAQGSHWDNATLFDNSGKATLGIKFYNKALNN